MSSWSSNMLSRQSPNQGAAVEICARKWWPRFPANSPQSLRRNLETNQPVTLPTRPNPDIPLNSCGYSETNQNRKRTGILARALGVVVAAGFLGRQVVHLNSVATVPGSIFPEEKSDRNFHYLRRDRWQRQIHAVEIARQLS